jgi:hypothetical protein
MLIDPCPPGAAEGVFLHGARRLLLVLHAGGSVVLIGAATHHLLEMRHYLRGNFHRERVERIYARVVAIAYVATFALGALLYPSYRVHVRGLYLDHHAPAYAGLFDLKEVYASLTLTVAVAIGALASTRSLADAPWLVRVYAVMSAIVCAVVWFNVIAGLLVTSVRGVG